MDFHEVANIFPLLVGSELDELVTDIKENGLLEPIVTYEGKIVDGRNRYRACELAGVDPVFEEWKQNGVSLIAWVIAKNLHRRHLTSSQLAACALESLAFFEAEANKRQTAVLKKGVQIQYNPVPQKIAEREAGEAREQAAKAFNTNRQYVQDAKRIQEKRPELISKIKSGEMTITQAKREIVRDEVKKEVQLPSDKYRIIYADPPWKYGNTMPDYFTTQDDHYPSMTVSEISAMDVQSMVEDNAVLFIWATSPILEEVFTVIRAWGFKYKSSFVWDKVKHNMGHYNSVRHEFLLVCVRGSCQPDVAKLFDSVISIERTEHSRKPDKFREIIDTIYPYGKRIELFARERHDGWSEFGNQLS